MGTNRSLRWGNDTGSGYKSVVVPGRVKEVPLPTGKRKVRVLKEGQPKRPKPFGRILPNSIVIATQLSSDDPAFISERGSL